ncbi:MAG: radical SAM protein [bacterium]|nr:radical SAM protein [bacterium]
MNMNSEQTYGFQSHLSPDFPSQIIVDVTEFCNLACIHCPQEAFSKSEAFGGRHLDPMLHKKLIDEVAADGKGICKYLRYTGQGETLLHPQFMEMIEYAGKHADVPINITTNGMLLKEAKAKRLLAAGVDVFDISIDANTPETYARVRKNGDLNITRPNVLRLLDLIKKGRYDTRVVVSFVEQPLNADESDDFKIFWEDAGVDYVIIRRLHSCAGSKEKLADKMRDESSVKRRPCLYPWERLVLSPTGQIGFCPADWKYQAKIAYFKDVTIKDVWKSKEMQDLRSAHLQNDYSSHDFCGQCPDWAATRWPYEGRAYSNMMQEFIPADLIDEEQG